MSVRAQRGRPFQGSWSPSEESVLRLMPAIGDRPLAYGEMRRRRLAQLPPPADEAESHRAYKRVDKELYDGLRRLVSRGMVTKDPEGRYSLAIEPALVHFADRCAVAEADLLRLIASRQYDDWPEEWSSPQALRELAEMDLDLLTKKKEDWRRLREELLRFVKRQDDLYGGIPETRIPEGHRSRLTGRKGFDRLMTELKKKASRLDRTG